MKFWRKLTGDQAILDAIERLETRTMASFSTITAAQQQEHTDLATLATLITQLLAAFASGAITPAQAQSLLDEINAQDATVKSSITAIQAALPAAPPATPPAA